MSRLSGQQTLGVHITLTPSAEVTGMYSFVWLFTSGMVEVLVVVVVVVVIVLLMVVVMVVRMVVSMDSGNSNSSPSLKQLHLLMEPSS